MQWQSLNGTVGVIFIFFVLSPPLWCQALTFAAWHLLLCDMSCLFISEGSASRRYCKWNIQEIGLDCLTNSTSRLILEHWNGDHRGCPPPMGTHLKETKLSGTLPASVGQNTEVGQCTGLKPSCVALWSCSLPQFPHIEVRIITVHFKELMWEVKQMNTCKAPRTVPGTQMLVLTIRNRMFLFSWWQ